MRSMTWSEDGRRFVIETSVYIESISFWEVINTIVAILKPYAFHVITVFFFWVLTANIIRIQTQKISAYDCFTFLLISVGWVLLCSLFP